MVDLDLWNSEVQVHIVSQSTPKCKFQCKQKQSYWRAQSVVFCMDQQIQVWVPQSANFSANRSRAIGEHNP
jgi:hypothetical protein